MTYDNTNSGALFKKDEATGNQPGYNGSLTTKCDHCGKNSDFWLAGWVKTAGQAAKNPGSRFFSLATTSKNEQAVSNQNAADSNFDPDDDIPF